MEKRSNIKYGFSVGMLVIFAILVLWSAIMLFVMFWAFITTFKSYGEFNNNVLGFLKKWNFENYIRIFDNFYVYTTQEGVRSKVYIERMFFNSFFTNFICAFLSVFVPFITAYAVSKFPNWVPSKILYAIVIICMIMPVVGSLPSEIQMTMKLGIYDTLFVMPFLKSSFLGMYFLIFYNICQSLSRGYTEAAYLDGANHYQVMFKIVFPMVWGSFKIMFVLNFIGFWNDFNTPLMFMESHPTVALGLYIFSLETDVIRATMPIKITAAVIVMIPPFILFVVLKDKIMNQLSLSGGIKE